MRNLYNPEIDQSKTDDLYNGTLIPRKTRGVAIAGTGILKRGLPLMSADGLTFTVWENGEEIAGILLSDIDISEIEEAQNADLAISGEFNLNKVEEVLGSKIDSKTIMSAWSRNIHLENNYEFPPVDWFPLG